MKYIKTYESYYEDLDKIQHDIRVYDKQASLSRNKENNLIDECRKLLIDAYEDLKKQNNETKDFEILFQG